VNSCRTWASLSIPGRSSAGTASSAPGSAYTGSGAGGHRATPGRLAYGQTFELIDDHRALIDPLV
jgi:hypothetical protein